MIISLIQALYDRRMTIPQDRSYYEQVLADIEFFDISPQMYWLLKQAGKLEEMPDFFRSKIEEKYRDALYQNMFIRNQMNIVLEQFDAAEIAAIPLKGTKFAEKYFGHLGARATSDIDLLVQPSDLQRAITCVKALGYSFEQERIPSHFHWSFSKVIPGSPIPLTIEIHWDLLKENTSNLSMEQFWKQATPMGTYRYIKELSDYHTFYMICLHGWRHNLGSLKYFIDIIQLIHVVQDGCRYETLFKDAHVHKTLKRITRTLAIVYHQFPHLKEIKELSLPNRTKLWWDYSTIRNLHQRTIRQYINWVYYQLFDYDNGKQSIQVLLNWKK
ncbi:hypothetical protein PAECIP111891_03101 [Paenibacillus allorhizoplanae]|uniref:Nucleotidyltransferase family protein n=1 Tax=Paenibacillus allorhizoplanae TaxID=2905648 RepID=A0ABM9C9H9_9BACL|nr:nucleotidyltransferase family protein [Paenibacillus allorhizoplanae]CAH1207796.1 hypothetical protein PAECIP111891_03101 [Paenibacillus allorhizoplanae]